MIFANNLIRSIAHFKKWSIFAPALQEKAFRFPPEFMLSLRLFSRKTKVVVRK
ncbi:hypothetical protein SAMN05421636_11215 [Pricia antarctica]|uniref:Uncharacterized protein n=1 Tax=Pricia antarctica TaxID=641691 RepID=A0A1G7IG97_9FLAO|nr:hypothetical protein SAMN05421636_11215 [Pricia antarctica]